MIDICEKKYRDIVWCYNFYIVVVTIVGPADQLQSKLTFLFFVISPFLIVFQLSLLTDWFYV